MYVQTGGGGITLNTHTITYTTHSHNSIITKVTAHARMHTQTHTHMQTHSNSVTICVRETSVYLFEAVQSPIYFSLSAFYCSDRHSPAEPPSAPLCPLSSASLTNLFLIYLFFCIRGLCHQQTAVEPLQPL